MEHLQGTSHKGKEKKIRNGGSVVGNYYFQSVRVAGTAGTTGKGRLNGLCEMKSHTGGEPLGWQARC